MLRRIKDKSKATTLRRTRRVRYKLKKDNRRVRLSIFISNLHIYAQLIDDVKGVSLASASTLDKTLKLTKTSNKDAASAVGKAIAEKGVKVGVTEVVFDRGGNLFHGKVKSLADSARENGLKF
jgi:large subunit ribosomal protein L18